MSLVLRREGILDHIVPLEETGLVRVAFTTRHGGISPEPRCSLNLSFTRGDEAEVVRENYRRAADAFGCDVSDIVLSRQPHGDLCEEVGRAEAGIRLTDEELPHVRDAVMTDVPGIVLATSHADCTPIYLLDPEHRAIAMVHAGWKGTSLRIAQKTVRAMRRRYGTNPEKLLAAVGPCIGPCCFEVGEDVRSIFEDLFPEMDLVDDTQEKAHVDLWRCNYLQLREMGIPEEQIFAADVCTACNTQDYFSHRREKGQTGTMAGMIELL